MSKEKIRIAIERSQKAYLLYKEDGRYFFQADRIYKANQIVYTLLQEYIYRENVNKELVITYIFHLEDWFLQFEEARKLIKHPTDVFVFERWEGAIAFPKDFLNK